MMMKPVAFFRNTWKKREKRPPEDQGPSRDPLPSPSIPNLPIARASFEPYSPGVHSTRSSAENFRAHPSQPRSPLPYSSTPPSSPRRFVEVEYPGGARLLTPTSPRRIGGFPYQVHSAGSSASDHDPVPPSPRRPPRPPSLDLYSPVNSPSSRPHPKPQRVENDLELLDRFLDAYLNDSDFESDDELSTPKACGFSERKTEKGRREHGPHVVANCQIQDGRRSADIPAKPASPKRQRIPYKSGSTPHLRPPPAAPPSNPPPQPNVDPLSLFPQPPPLIIRKKIPRPLVLHNISSVNSLDNPSPSFSAFPPSPSIASSSPDSTPLTTPTSPRSIPSPSVFRAPVTSSNYMLKHAIGRCQVQSPQSPTTTHISTPPTSPVAHDSMSSRPILSRPPLRVAVSALNLRSEVYPAHTHRTTSSDSSSSSAQPSDKSHFNREYKAHSRLREEHRTAQVDSAESSESHVQWGYAI